MGIRDLTSLKHKTALTPRHCFRLRRVFRNCETHADVGSHDAGAQDGQ